jgi:RHS repeat-associated protein
LTPGELAAGACQEATTFTYDALSRRTAMTLPNGTQTTYTYDPASQVTNILHQLTATSAQINQAAYAYNPVGNRTSLTDRRGPQSFGYDNLDRLTSASHPLLATPQAFAYDPVGNRTTAGHVTNAGNQLTADSTHSYQYDDNGNLTRKTLLATGNYTQYTYDAENRLTKVEEFVAGNPTAAFTSTYRYDGLGRRIEKVANGQTKRYIYDGEDILLEYDGSNVLQARYTHGPGIDEPIAVTKGSSTYFYHQDGLGTVTDLTDSSGVTAKSYAYDAYGNILESPGSVEQPYTYTSREFDSESGLYYYRARYYDPASGRFLQKDPVWLLSKNTNRYPYVESNPLNLKDPSGENPILGGIIVTHVALGVIAACAVCATETAQEGDRRYPSIGPDDPNNHMRHCWTSCGVSQKCGRTCAFVLGWLNEMFGVHDQKDVDSNTKGRDCSINGDCVSCCKQCDVNRKEDS